MLTIKEERRILDAAPVYLRVAIILLAQTGGRTYSEGFSLRWSQVDLEGKLIRLNNNVKTPRFRGAHSFVSIRLRRFAGVEEGTSFEERICLPKPGPAQPAHLNG